VVAAAYVRTRSTRRLRPRTTSATAVTPPRRERGVGVIEVLRRTPRWLLLLTLVLVIVGVVYALTYIVWVVAGLGAIVAWKVGQGVLRGWRTTR
jgi:hypothetical protein